MAATFPAGLGSQEWRPSTYHDVVLAFLRAEWRKRDAVVVAAITSTPDVSQLIVSPDLHNYAENGRRLALLREWRKPLLDRIPADTTWWHVRSLKDCHLDQIRAIAAPDWVDRADRNEIRNVARRRPQPLNGAWSAWPPPILWAHDRAGPFTILEGNNRLTAYCSTAGQAALDVECFVGLSLTPCCWHLPDHAWP